MAEGRLAVFAAEAFKGVAVSVADGVTIVVPHGGDGINLASAKSVAWDGTSRNMVIDMAGVSAGDATRDVPLVVVSASNAAAYLGALSVRLENAPEGFVVKLPLLSETIGDNVVLKARVAHTGFTIMMR